MTLQISSTRSQVIYRATTLSGRDVELRLAMDAAQATVADAWRRLSALHRGVDPFSLEIECREVARPCAAEPLRGAAVTKIGAALAELA